MVCRSCSKAHQEGCWIADIEGSKEYIKNPPECLLAQLRGSPTKTDLSAKVLNKNQEVSIGAVNDSMGDAVENKEVSKGCRKVSMGNSTHPHMGNSTPAISTVTPTSSDNTKDWAKKIIKTIEDKCSQNEIFRRMKRQGLSKGGTRYYLYKLEEKGEIASELIPNDLNMGVLKKNPVGVRLKMYFLTVKGKEVHIYHNKSPLNSVSKVLEDNEIPELQHGVQYCADIVKRPEKEPKAEHQWNPNNWKHDGKIFPDPSGEKKFGIRVLSHKMIADFARSFVETFPPSTTQDAKFERLAKDWLDAFAEKYKYVITNVRKNRVPDRKVPDSEELADQFDESQTDEKTNSTTDASDADKDNPRHIEFHGKAVKGDVKAADQKAKVNYSKFMRAMDGLENLKPDLRAYHDDFEISTAHMIRDTNTLIETGNKRLEENIGKQLTGAIQAMTPVLVDAFKVHGEENLKLLLTAVTAPHILQEIAKKQVDDLKEDMKEIIKKQAEGMKETMKKQIEDELKKMQQTSEPDKKMYG